MKFVENLYAIAKLDKTTGTSWINVCEIIWKYDAHQDV